MSNGDESWVDSHSQVESELATLGRLLSASEGVFSFSIAICNSPSKVDSLIDTICGRVDGVCRVRIDKGVRDVFGFVSENAGKNCGSGVFVTGLERIVPSDGGRSVLQNMNAVRESWKERFSCPVVFWIPEYVATLLSKYARDLWSWISPKLDFSREGYLGSTDYPPRAGPSSLSFAYEEKLQRIAELEDRMREAEKGGDEGLYSHVASWLNEVGTLKLSIGRLDEAQGALERVIEVASIQGDEGAKAAALGNMGVIHEMRGDLERAEEMHVHSLEIKERLGLQEGLSNSYSNLGTVYWQRGKLDKAEEMHLRSLEIAEKLGREEGMASQYGNLGLIYKQRGELDKAEEMHLKSLEAYEKLGGQEGMASGYVNLGSIYGTRGELDKAEEMFRKGLEIDERLGRQEGMANSYGNLGLIYVLRGELDKANEVLRQSLAISEAKGLSRVTANQYVNLGEVYVQRGDKVRAREYWEKALGLYERIGMGQMVEKVEGWIRGLC